MSPPGSNLLGNLVPVFDGVVVQSTSTAYKNGLCYGNAIGMVVFELNTKSFLKSAMYDANWTYYVCRPPVFLMTPVTNYELILCSMEIH